jgi:hypothetical protein
MNTRVDSPLAGLIMAFALGITSASSAGAEGFRFVGCSLDGVGYIVISSANPDDFGRDCETVVNELVSDGYRIESELTPAQYSTVVYRMARPGRN